MVKAEGGVNLTEERFGTHDAAMRPTRRSGTCSLLLIAFFLASCTGGEGPPTEDPTRGGGTLRVGILDTNGCPLTLCGTYSFDPQIGYNNIAYELGRCCLLRSLLSFNGQSTAGGGGLLRPDLAESLPDISPDGLSWTFHLRPGLRYGPPLAGTPIRSQDFVRSIESLLGPRPMMLTDDWGSIHDSYLGEFLNLGGIVEGATDYMDGRTEHIAGLETPDDRTLVVHVTKPTGTLGYLLAFPDTAPIPANPFDPSARFGIATDQGRLFGRYLASIGPYMVEGANDLDYSLPPDEWQQPVGDGAATYTLVRNPSWSRDLDPLRAAAVDRIVISRVAGSDEAIDQVSSGALDLIWEWSLTSPGSFITAPEGIPEELLERSAGDSMRFLGLNVAIPPLDDLHVRRAIAFAIDRPEIAQVFSSGGVPNRVATHVGLNSQENNLLLGFDPFGAQSGADLDAARAEMAQSTYDRDRDGRCDDCETIQLVVPDYDPPRVDAAPLIAESLGAIGLRVRPKVLDADRFGRLYGNPEAHVAMRLDSWFKDGSTGSTWFPPLFGSSKLGVVASAGNEYLIGASEKELERWGYDVRSVPSVDERIATCLGQAFEAQVQCWAELDAYLTERVVPWVPLIESTGVTPVSDRVSRFSVDQSAAQPIAALDQVVVGPEATVAPSSPEPAATFPDIPAGVYRMTITPADLRRFDVPTRTRDDVWNATGMFTMVLEHGTWYWTQRADHPIPGALSIAGTYSGNESSVQMKFEANADNALPGPTLGWDVDADGSLRFTMQRCNSDDQVLCAYLRAQFTAHPWERVD